jgi:hypothetical protein
MFGTNLDTIYSKKARTVKFKTNLKDIIAGIFHVKEFYFDKNCSNLDIMSYLKKSMIYMDLCIWA